MIDGLQQRARLFELILADLLGPQTILHRDMLPPIFASGLSLHAEPRGLRAYAAELIRCPDDIWRVSDDLVGGAGNDPSAHLLEAPALAGFLPALCRFLLGERLRLASLPSRWLADHDALPQVVVSRHRWVIVDAFQRGPATTLADLTAAQRIMLQNQIDAEPWRFAARLLVRGAGERIALARNPNGAWVENNFNF